VNVWQRAFARSVGRYSEHSSSVQPLKTRASHTTDTWLGSINTHLPSPRQRHCRSGAGSFCKSASFFPNLYVLVWRGMYSSLVKQRYGRGWDGAAPHPHRGGDCSFFGDTFQGRPDAGIPRRCCRRVLRRSRRWWLEVLFTPLARVVVSLFSGLTCMRVVLTPSRPSRKHSFPYPPPLLLRVSRSATRPAMEAIARAIGESPAADYHLPSVKIWGCLLSLGNCEPAHRHRRTRAPP